MEPRLNFGQAAPDGIKAMRALEHCVNQSSGLEPSLRELIKIRASQINSCAYCIDMHTIDARAAGESGQRLYSLNAWQETPFFTERERAALEWTEAITMIADSRASDEAFLRVRQLLRKKSW